MVLCRCLIVKGKYGLEGNMPYGNEDRSKMLIEPAGRERILDAGHVTRLQRLRIYGAFFLGLQPRMSYGGIPRWRDRPGPLRSGRDKQAGLPHPGFGF